MRLSSPGEMKRPDGSEDAEACDAHQGVEQHGLAQQTLGKRDDSTPVMVVEEVDCVRRVVSLPAPMQGEGGPEWPCDCCPHVHCRDVRSLITRA